MLAAASKRANAATSAAVQLIIIIFDMAGGYLLGQPNEALKHHPVSGGLSVLGPLDKCD